MQTNLRNDGMANYLPVRFLDDRDGTGKLLARAEADGESGVIARSKLLLQTGQRCQPYANPTPTPRLYNGSELSMQLTTIKQQSEKQLPWSVVIAFAVAGYLSSGLI